MCRYVRDARSLCMSRGVTGKAYLIASDVRLALFAGLGIRQECIVCRQVGEARFLGRSPHGETRGRGRNAHIFQGQVQYDCNVFLH